MKSGICVKCNKFHNRIEFKGMCRPCFRKQRRLDSPLIKCQCDPSCTEMIHSIGYNGDKKRFAQGHGSKGENNSNYGKYGAVSANWKGGMVYNKIHEQFLLYKPYHPYSDCRGYVAQYRIIKEIYLSILNGYPTYINPNLIIHHINHVRMDNRPQNLQVLTKKEHQNIHKLGVKGKKYNKKI